MSYQTVPGSEQFYCRVKGCQSFTRDNVPYGYCDTHAGQHERGAVHFEKRGFPAIGSPVGQFGVSHARPQLLTYNAADPDVARLTADNEALRAQLAKAERMQEVLSIARSELEAQLLALRQERDMLRADFAKTNQG